MLPIILIILGFISLILSLIIWINVKVKLEHVNENKINYPELLDYVNYFSQKIDEFEQLLLDLTKEFEELNNYNLKDENINVKQVDDKILVHNINNGEDHKVESANYRDFDMVNQVKKLKHKGYKNIEIAKQLNRSVREIDIILKLIRN